MILVVEDEHVARRALIWLLREKGYDAEGVESAEDALELVKEKGPPDVAVVDLNLPGMSGMEFIKTLAASQPPVPSVLMTASSGEAAALEAANAKRCSFMRKPVNLDRLMRVISAKGQPA